MSDQREDRDGQVSETSALRAGADDEGLQQTEGIPPGDEAEQEDQSAAEAEISPEHDGVDNSVEHARGEETE